MKIALFLAVCSMFVFGFLMFTFLPAIILFFVPSDDFAFQFHSPTYAGLILLCGIVVFSTRLILEHINDVHNRLLKEIRKQAENSAENSNE
ncbi:MAG: hypothetical protein FWG68_01155 [Defluviitaleaceae bacterium]|nr:hypothetical protein [Defluviitaleaceae bacterium]